MVKVEVVRALMPSCVVLWDGGRLAKMSDHVPSMKLQSRTFRKPVVRTVNVEYEASKGPKQTTLR